MTAADVLRDAAALVREGWCQNTCARDRDGMPIGDMLRAHKGHMVAAFLAPGDGSAGEVWIAEARPMWEDPSAAAPVVTVSGPSPAAAIDELGRRLAEAGT